MQFIKLFEEYVNFIKAQLILEGGAGGHMLYPFELGNVTSGSDLIDIFNKSIESLRNSPAAVKLDGINVSIRLIDLDGQKTFVIDRGSNKVLDAEGVTVDKLKDRFGEGHGMIEIGTKVLNIFNNAIGQTKPLLKKLGLWDDPNKLFNIEYIENGINVTEYSSNYIAIHNIRQIERKNNRTATFEVSYDEKSLLEYVNKLNEVSTKYGFNIVGSVPAILKGNPNISKVLGQSIKIKAGEKTIEGTLSQLLSNLQIPDNSVSNIKTTDGKRISPLNKSLVNDVIFNEVPLDEVVVNESDFDTCIAGIIVNTFVILAGDEILRNMSSSIGDMSKQEGVIIRDPNVSQIPFKIVGSFILRSLKSRFKKGGNKLNESLITEGGHALANCVPIKGDDAREIVNELTELFKKQGISVEPIGSSVKKTANQFCGDIDMATAYSWDKHNDIVSLLSKNGYDYNISDGFKIINFAYPYNDAFAQVDLMFTDNMTLTKFNYWSPDFTKEESSYKGLARTILMMILVRAVPVDEEPEYFSDEEYDGKYKDVIKKRYRYIYDLALGVKKVLEDFTGKTKPLSKAKKVKEYEKIIANTPEDVMKFIFGENYDPADFVSFESLWKAAHTKIPNINIDFVEQEMKKIANEQCLDIKELN